MVVYVNDKNEIKAVGSTEDLSLTPVVIYDDDNPFANMSSARICCYRITVVDGKFVTASPYIDSSLLDHFDQVGKQSDSASKSVSSEYNQLHGYSNGEYCMYKGGLYRFTKTKGVGIAPTDRNYWEACDIASELNRITAMIQKKEV